MPDRLLVELGAEGSVTISSEREHELPNRAGPPFPFAFPLDAAAREDLRWYLETWGWLHQAAYGECELGLVKGHAHRHRSPDRRPLSTVGDNELRHVRRPTGVDQLHDLHWVESTHVTPSLDIRSWKLRLRPNRVTRHEEQW